MLKYHNCKDDVGSAFTYSSAKKGSMKNTLMITGGLYYSWLDCVITAVMPLIGLLELR